MFTEEVIADTPILHNDTNNSDNYFNFTYIPK